MFLVFIHIGGDTMVRLKDVIGIFDIQSENSEGTAFFLKRSKEQDRVEVVELGEIKSYVVTNNKVYFSPISSLTLKKRALYMDTTGKIEVE